MRDINVYGPIGYWDSYEDYGMDLKRFSDLLKEADGDDVTVHINSTGGDVFDANAMAELLRSYPGAKSAVIEGIAASAASYFALTADTVSMNPSALLMIHNPSSYAYGTADDMRSTAERLDKVRGTISRIYVDKTGMDREEIEGLMDAETWFDADEALDKGFVDRLTTDKPVTAMVDERALESFKNAPASLAAAPTGESRRTICSANGPDTGAGAAPDDAGAASRVVCSNGSFLKVGGE